MQTTRGVSPELGRNIVGLWSRGVSYKDIRTRFARQGLTRTAARQVVRNYLEYLRSQRSA